MFNHLYGRVLDWFGQVAEGHDHPNLGRLSSLRHVAPTFGQASQRLLHVLLHVLNDANYGQRAFVWSNLIIFRRTLRKHGCINVAYLLYYESSILIRI